MIIGFIAIFLMFALIGFYFGIPNEHWGLISLGIGCLCIVGILTKAIFEPDEKTIPDGSEFTITKVMESN